MSGWISVTDRLPPSGVPVIASYRNSAGMNRRIRAEYIAQNTRERSDDIDDIASEYDEETDTVYWTAGWYELMNNWDDYASIAVHEGEITHWHAMPECPVEDEMLERLDGEP